MMLAILNNQGGPCMMRTSENYSPQMQEAIRRRATELYRQGGAVAGQDAQNCFSPRPNFFVNRPRIPFAAPLSLAFRAWSTPGNTKLRQPMATLPANGSQAIPSRFASLATSSTFVVPTVAISKPPS
jgi:hypothetical protein